MRQDVPAPIANVFVKTTNIYVKYFAALGAIPVNQYTNEQNVRVSRICRGICTTASVIP